jgi:uncharacterized protein (TIGR03067 family)
MSASACLLLASCILLAPARDDAADKEAKALAGTWKLIKAEERGRNMPEEELKNFQLQIEGNKFIITRREQPMPATFKVNPAKSPKELDVTWTEGPHAGSTVKCVYELKEDEFTFRAGDRSGSGDRPKSLTEGGQILFVFKKAK